jgi:hypothetical protein
VWKRSLFPKFQAACSVVVPDHDLTGQVLSLFLTAGFDFVPGEKLLRLFVPITSKNSASGQNLSLFSPSLEIYFILTIF